MAKTVDGRLVLPGGMAEYGKDRVVPEEATITAAREACEELGLCLSPKTLQPMATISGEHPWNTDDAFAIDTPFILDLTQLCDTRPSLVSNAPGEIQEAFWMPMSDIAYAVPLSDYHRTLVDMATRHLGVAVTVII
ncbi:NUDIX hydrolase [Candidatus Saccharibacteria bacterium]|nr:MAG: NUDIX hydrolase [Candidatus Saccharibacteria bacterium]